MSTRRLFNARIVSLHLIPHLIAQFETIAHENVKLAFPKIAFAFRNGNWNAVIKDVPLIVWFMRYTNPIELEVLKMFEDAGVDFNYTHE